ncbi:MAG TPA: NAD-dependent epimerase/dehydratase family protein [Verrucomicrobiae bacterium]|nr:NAD-dependent epimerase/dehydratase family protein [Verrucomicrobiae bacterium]
MNPASKGDGVKGVSLITGAAGFIGMHLATELLDRGHRVIAIDNFSSGFRENLPLDVELIEGSIADPRLVAGVFEQHPIRYVFHLAAYAAEGLSHFVRTLTYRTNVLGSANLINAAVNAGTVQCFVFTSSVAVYGRATGVMREDDVPRPIDPYGISKHAIELDLRAADELFGLPSIIFRPHNVYGEGQNLWDPYRNVIGIFMQQIRQGRPLTLFGDGSQTRAFTHISDVAPILAEAVEHPSAYHQVFNIGSDRAHTVLEVADRVSQAMGVPPRLEFLPARLEAHDASCSHERLRAFFGDRSPGVELDDGLKRMAAWAQRVLPRPRVTAGPIEIHQQLPEVWRDLERPRPRVRPRPAAVPARALMQGTSPTRPS